MPDHGDPEHGVALLDELTPFDRRLAILLARGLPNRGIAQELHLSHRTVEAHLSRLYAHLGVRTRYEALTRLCGCPDATTLRAAKGTVQPLTARESEVAAAVARGESNQAVASRLGVSVRTVENHLVSIYRKLGVSRRSDLMRMNADGLAADLQ